MKVLTQTTFTDKCILGIFPIDPKIVPKNLAFVAELGAGTDAGVISVVSHEVPIEDQNQSAGNGIANLTTIPAQIESSKSS